MYHKIVSNSAKSVLKIDLDFKRIPKRSLETIDFLKFYYTVLGTYIYKSASGNHHIVVEIKEKISDYEIILIQLLCGSDRKREWFNYKRVKEGLKMKDWNLLFSKKMNREIKI